MLKSSRCQVTEFNSNDLSGYKKASVERRMKGTKDEAARAINGGKLLSVIKLEESYLNSVKARTM